jgi:hypothetical protein
MSTPGGTRSTPGGTRSTPGAQGLLRVKALQILVVKCSYCTHI